MIGFTDGFWFGVGQMTAAAIPAVILLVGLLVWISWRGPR